MASNFAGMPHFNRTSLWMIIAILLPLITILNQSGQTPKIEDKPTTILNFPLADLQFNRRENNAWIELPGSGEISISIITASVPKNRLKIPPHQDFKVSIRNNYAVTWVKTPSEQAALEVTLEFLQKWLPPINENNLIIITGEVDQLLTEEIRNILQRSNGESLPLDQKVDSYVSRITIPEMGSQEQLAFLIAAEIVRQRVTGYQPKLTWDHSDQISYLDLNTTLKPEWLTPASSEEIARVREYMVAAAARSDRSSDQIHRYLVTQALYDLPASFIQRQSDLLNQISDEAVNNRISNFISVK